MDVEYLQRLAPLTNIVPLVSRADLLFGKELALLKDNIMSAFESNSIKPFNFEQVLDGSARPDLPYAISSMASKDNETMDASLLMSPDYVQPLLESELPFLVSHIFERDTISWLRHSAARKFVQWREASTPQNKPQDLYRPLSQRPSPTSLTGAVGTTTSSFALARVTDHTQREERIAQVRLANWAADLQRSLANERRRFEQLARSERAVWLTERLGECVQDGSIVPVSGGGGARSSPSSPLFDGTLVKQETYARSSRKRAGGGGGMDPRDPLGLLQLNAELKRRSWMVLQVVSSLGVLGGLALYISRSWQTTEGESSSRVWEWVLDAL